MPKSAFVSAVRKTATFIYPSPLDQENEDGKTPFKALTDTDAYSGDDGKPLPEDQRPQITVRIPISAADVDAVADLTQPALLLSQNGDGVAATATEPRIHRMNRGLFGLLVESWNLSPQEPSVELYDKLDQWAASWVRVCLAEANRRGTAPDFQPPKPSSSETAEPSPAASSAAKSRR